MYKLKGRLPTKKTPTLQIKGSGLSVRGGTRYFYPSKMVFGTS